MACQDILNDLIANNAKGSGYYTVEQLQAIAAQASIEISGAKAGLEVGGMGNECLTGCVVRTLGQQTLWNKQENTMAFVNELVPEADKSRIDFSAIKDPITGVPRSLYKWCVDRERDVFLIPTRTGGPDFPEHEYFVLSWKNELINIELESRHIGNRVEGYTYTWRMRHLYIPDYLQAEQEEIISVLKEALDAYSKEITRLIKCTVNTVHFDF